MLLCIWQNNCVFHTRSCMDGFGSYQVMHAPLPVNESSCTLVCVTVRCTRSLVHHCQLTKVHACTTASCTRSCMHHCQVHKVIHASHDSDMRPCRTCRKAMSGHVEAQSCGWDSWNRHCPKFNNRVNTSWWIVSLRARKVSSAARSWRVQALALWSHPSKCDRIYQSRAVHLFSVFQI